jgi:hypothetical protein
MTKGGPQAALRSESPSALGEIRVRLLPRSSIVLFERVPTATAQAGSFGIVSRDGRSEVPVRIASVSIRIAAHPSVTPSEGCRHPAPARISHIDPRPEERSTREHTRAREEGMMNSAAPGARARNEAAASNSTSYADGSAARVNDAHAGAVKAAAYRTAEAAAMDASTAARTGTAPSGRRWRCSR